MDSWKNVGNCVQFLGLFCCCLYDVLSIYFSFSGSADIVVLSHRCGSQFPVAARFWHAPRLNVIMWWSRSAARRTTWDSRCDNTSSSCCSVSLSANLVMKTQCLRRLCCMSGALEVLWWLSLRSIDRYMPLYSGVDSARTFCSSPNSFARLFLLRNDSVNSARY